MSYKIPRGSLVIVGGTLVGEKTPHGGVTFLRPLGEHLGGLLCNSMSQVAVTLTRRQRERLRALATVGDGVRGRVSTRLTPRYARIQFSP